MVLGDRGPQTGRADRLGVAEHVRVQRLVRGREHRRGRRGRGLARDEVEQVTVAALSGAGRGEQVHDVERRHVRAPRDGKTLVHRLNLTGGPGGRFG